MSVLFFMVDGRFLAKSQPLCVLSVNVCFIQYKRGSVGDAFAFFVVVTSVVCLLKEAFEWRARVSIYCLT